MGADPRFYWSVDIPGMTEERAQRLVGDARSEGLEAASVVNPKVFLTMHMDRSTVEMIHRALARQSAAGESETYLKEILGEWLNFESGGSPD